MTERAGERGREGRKEREGLIFIFWFTPKVATITMAGPGRSCEPAASF